ncbi:MAG: hypothetical protein ACRD1H_06170 [Vicinamibacterales bacterium]
MRRLKAAGLALAILVIGLGAIIALTEREVGVSAAGPRLLTLTDIVRSLDAHGIDPGDSGAAARHPLLKVGGYTLSADGVTIEVYFYATVAERVTNEQTLQRRLGQLQAFGLADGQIERITSVRNVLILYQTDDSGLALAVQHAARSLTDSD